MQPRSTYDIIYTNAFHQGKARALLGLPLNIEVNFTKAVEKLILEEQLDREWARTVHIKGMIDGFEKNKWENSMEQIFRIGLRAGLKSVSLITHLTNRGIAFTILNELKDKKELLLHINLYCIALYLGYTNKQSSELVNRFKYQDYLQATPPSSMNALKTQIENLIPLLGSPDKEPTQSAAEDALLRELFINQGTIESPDIHTKSPNEIENPNPIIEDQSFNEFSTHTYTSEDPDTTINKNSPLDEENAYKKARIEETPDNQTSPKQYFTDDERDKILNEIFSKEGVKFKSREEDEILNAFFGDKSVQESGTNTQTPNQNNKNQTYQKPLTTTTTTTTTSSEFTYNLFNKKDNKEEKNDKDKNDKNNKNDTPRSVL